ncbi:DUF262 domain-containing protein [Roseimicrobium sp. ORNL1]|uniref:DUF262 domain-containing protein n=1 Tax=Roseimicrobium sp. ORNL1 TaxID=2711231 RepID=UPI0013E1DFF4|nr:DUF262 domain-containing protein [Roseimicrobium sp. ORNL1]QIF03122.1 DUF262 domain-containing protein [Roseimicrobium sp. ORNL1]
MKTVATNKKLRELILGLESGTLISRPDFQRRLVWTNKEKVAFIQTVLSEYPFPEIYVAAGEVDEDTGAAKEYLVDGQQRITTLFHYFKDVGDIKLPAGMKKYADLTSDAKKNFLQYDVVVRDLGNLKIDEIKKIFQTINSTSYSLNAMEIDNSRFAGEFKKMGDKVASKDFFERHNFFSQSDVKRMQDLRYALVLMSTMMSGYFNDSSKIEEFLATYNDTFEEGREIEKRIDSAFEFIDSCNFEPSCRVWNKADLFTLCVELDRKYFSENLVPKKTAISRRLKTFYSTMNGDEIDDASLDVESAKYYKAAIQGSNSRSRRIARGEVIEDLI